MTRDYIVAGGGIVGLATAMSLGARFPRARVLLVEKEPRLALHQTGRNSGVVHSGIYYKPGSFKARFCRDGRLALLRFCDAHGVEHRTCGKVIVATGDRELPLLENLYQRGVENLLNPRRLSAAELREIEPHAAGIAAVHVPATGVVDYSRVAAKFAEVIRSQGGEILASTRVERLRSSGAGHVVETNQGAFETRYLVNCCGLQSDRIARLDGEDPGARIVPFRGEYYELKKGKRDLVKTLIYPVPDPSFPFLGVHCTRMIDGSVHLGPNAVLAFKREGYRKTDFSPRDFFETMAFPGFWRLARRHASQGAGEIARSLSKRLFVKSLRKLVPEIESTDIVPSEAGVRAQALRPDGSLVDDFLIKQSRRAIHVCNAPSPAATASLEIAREIVDRIPV